MCCTGLVPTSMLCAKRCEEDNISSPSSSIAEMETNSVIKITLQFKLYETPQILLGIAMVTYSTAQRSCPLTRCSELARALIVNI